MSAEERLLLDAMRHRLNVESLHVTFVSIAGAPEFQLRSGGLNPEFERMSPYQWSDTIPYRTKPYKSAYISQIVHYGVQGSASLLQLVHSVPFDAIFEKLVAEHLKLHVALFSNADISGDMTRSRLNLEERAAVSWAAKGYTAAETAKIMRLLRRTVETRILTARGKLRASSVASAVYLAICSRQLD